MRTIINEAENKKKIRKRMQSFIGFYFVPTVIQLNYLQIDTKRFANYCISSYLCAIKL